MPPKTTKMFDIQQFEEIRNMIKSEIQAACEPILIKVEETYKKVDLFIAKVEGIEKVMNNEILKLNSSVNDLEQYSRKCNLEINGIPTSENENLTVSIDESAQVPTSSRPDRFTEMKSELPSTDENSDSNSEPPPVPAIRKSRKSYLDISIPDSIRKIITETPGVLDVRKLEAFFNNVKKKSSPCMVARQYTEDVAGLKTQLQSIKDKYYHAPGMHLANENKFMKWFEFMLERFDRMPKNSSSLHQA